MIYRSLFRDRNSVLTAATMLAEIGDCRERYAQRDVIAGDAGQAAVARESGKRKVAHIRWACNKRLRGAFCTLADSSRHHNPWAADLYARARADGTTTPADPHPRPRLVPHRLALLARPHPMTPRHRSLQANCAVTIPTSSGPVPTSPPSSGCSATLHRHGGRSGRARSA